MADEKADRDQAKEEIWSELTGALEDVKKATTSQKVDEAVQRANAAATRAVDMANEAIKKATVLGHAPEDEDVEVELRDFAIRAQKAAQNVKAQGNLSKALKKKHGGVGGP